jgi:hypothetical protein
MEFGGGEQPYRRASPLNFGLWFPIERYNVAVPYGFQFSEAGLQSVELVC